MNAALEERHAEIGRQLKAKISRVLMDGFWFCYGCDQICERVEGEQGQPASCNRCKSPNIEWHPPAWESEASL